MYFYFHFRPDGNFAGGVPHGNAFKQRRECAAGYHARFHALVENLAPFARYTGVFEFECF